MKAKFPLGKKKTQDDELEENLEEESVSSDDATGSTEISDVEEESDHTVVSTQNASLLHKLKSKIQSLQKGKDREDSEETETAGADDEAAVKKKKKSKIIQIVIGAGLVLFLLSDYIIPTEEPVNPEGGESASFKRPERKKKPKSDDAAVAETPATDTPAAETPAAETPSEITDTTTDTPADSSVTVTSEDVPADTTTPTTDTTVTEPPTDTTISDTPSIESPGDTTTEDTTITDTPVSPDVPTDMSTVDTIDGGETTTPSDENLTDQILQDLENQAKTAQPVEQKKEYVSPPDYEYRGRGLVYNCTGKHWACVDAPSYKTCEDNASSVKYLNKKIECHPFNVYETPKGCENMQNRMVSAAAKTTFCNE